MTATSGITYQGVTEGNSKRGLWLVVFAFLIGIYVAVSSGVLSLLPPELSVYIVQPLLWIALAATALYASKQSLDAGPVLNLRLAPMALLAGAFQIAVSILVGLLYGFGHSPYSHSFAAMVGNLFYVGTMLLGIEMSRAYLMAGLGKRNVTATLVLMVPVFSIICIPAVKFFALKDTPTALRIVGTSILPTFAENVLACFLALLGGPVPAIIYRGALLAFEWLSPVLPKAHWTITAFVDTLTPLLSLMVIHSRFFANTAPEEESQLASPKPKGVSMLWVITGFLAVGLLWFNTGMFGYRPFVVVGDSMEPTLLAGDMIVTQQVPAESIQVGDVIRFYRNKAFVLHRVKEIQNEGGNIVFITRGDGNNVDDDPVPAEALQGKAVFTIPKIGWVSIAFRSILQWRR